MASKAHLEGTASKRSRRMKADSTVWVTVKADATPVEYEYPSSKTVKKFMIDLHFNPDEYLVTWRDEIIQEVRRLHSIDTSREHSLKFVYFELWAKFDKDLPVTIRCTPFTPIAKLFKQSDIQMVAYYKGKEVYRYESAGKLSTSREEPLVIKKLFVTVYVDDKKLDRPIINCISVNEVIATTSDVVKSKLTGAAYKENGFEVKDLIKFIFDTTEEERVLWLKRADPGKPSYPHSHSVSKAADKSPSQISSYSSNYNLYSHWFAMQIYDKYCEDPSRDARQFAERFQRLMDLKSFTPQILETCERSYTALFFQALDRFLFPDGESACVLHQPTLLPDAANHRNIPDGYIARLIDGLPSTPILSSDFKPKFSEVVVNESLGYCQSVLSACGLFVPILAMPCTPEDLCLYLCWPMENSNKHATIKICHASQGEFANFFSALKFAVEKLPLIRAGGFKVEPIEGVVLSEHLKKPNVHFHDDKMYKLFDMRLPSGARPNLKVIKDVLGDDYLSGEELDLTKDGRFKCLTYLYIKIGKKILTFKDFEPIMTALNQLHKSGYVHSDVRYSNMVFPSDGDAKLIDFDLMDKAGTTYYPPGYNHINERHLEAQALMERQIAHDRYSLIQTILNNAKLTDEVCNKLTVLRDNVSSYDDNFLEELKACVT